MRRASCLEQPCKVPHCQKWIATRDRFSLWTGPFRGCFQFLFSSRLFFARARCLSAGLRYLRLTRLPRHNRGPVPGGNRSAASCPCTVLRPASYHYATRSPFIFSSRRDQKRARQIYTLERVATLFLGYDMTLRAPPAAQKFTEGDRSAQEPATSFPCLF